MMTARNARHPTPVKYSVSRTCVQHCKNWSTQKPRHLTTERAAKRQSTQPMIVFYRGDIAEEIVRASAEHGGLMTMADLDNWQVHIEEPVTTNYKGIDVYKLTHWVQGPVMLQALNILEQIDLKGMGYNSARYIHALYQAMNLSFADRDFYYGDPYMPPVEPIAGLLSKKYAAQRREQIDWQRNNPNTKPGDPYPFSRRQKSVPETARKVDSDPADGRCGRHRRLPASQADGA